MIVKDNSEQRHLVYNLVKYSLNNVFYNEIDNIMASIIDINFYMLRKIMSAN